jgi:hypothetical protein
VARVEASASVTTAKLAAKPMERHVKRILRIRHVFLLVDYVTQTPLDRRCFCAAMVSLVREKCPGILPTLDDSVLPFIAID